MQSIVDHHCAGITLQQPFSGAVAYLGTYLNRRGLSFDYAAYSGRNEELEKKLASDICCVAISTTFIVDINLLKEIVNFIRKHNATCKISVGGVFVANIMEQYQTDLLRWVVLRKIDADFYIRSYFGEESLALLVEGLKQGAPLLEIPNLYFLQDKGFHCANPVRETIQIQEHTADWNLFRKDIGLYVPIRTSISCPFQCAFCSYPVYGGPYQSLDETTIDEDLKTLSTISSVKILNFIDDSFNVPNRRFKTILHSLVRGRYGFQWHSFFRCTDVDDETIGLMKESGCRGIMIGLESGAPEVLKNMNKRIGLGTAKRLINKLKKAGIVTYAMFIVGFPGETVSTLKQTIDFINEAAPDFYAVSPWHYNTSASVHSQREKFGLTGQGGDWSHNTMRSGDVQKHMVEMYYQIKNPTLLNMNYSILYQLLYYNVPLETILKINQEKTNIILNNLGFPSRTRG